MAEVRSSDRNLSEDESSGVTINVSARRITRVLVLIALFLTLMSVAVEFAKIALGFGNMRGSVPLFSLINEDSLGTWFSSTALLVCSVLLMAIAFSKKVASDRFFLHWGVLSVIFLYLSVDEGSMIHEKLGGIIGQLVLRATGIPQEGALARAWVIPGVVLVLVFALVYLRFFIALPPKTRRLFFVAGLLFIMGAVGIEMVAAFQLNFYGGARKT